MNRYMETGAAFDQASHGYDHSFTYSTIGILQRKRVYHYLNETLEENKALKILEINCGTGEDAIWMAKKGHLVTGIDVSSGMIEKAVKKLSRESRDLQVNFSCMSFDDLKSHFEPHSFDVIFSDFGGLNCIDHRNFESLADDFSNLLKPGGKFIAVIMGRKCLWEMLYFILKGKPLAALRRLSKKSVVASVGSARVPAWYFSPDTSISFFKGKLHFKEVRPVGICIPPSYLENFFKKKHILLSLLQKAEPVFNFSFLADFADHYFISFVKGTPPVQQHTSNS